MKHIEQPDFDASMKREMKSLQRNIKDTENNYGESLFKLTVALGYINKLLGNAKVAAYFKANYADIFSGFKAMVKADTLAPH